MIRTLTVLDLDLPPLASGGLLTVQMCATLDAIPAPAWPLLRDYLNIYLTDAEHGSECALCNCWTGYSEPGRWRWQTLVTDGTVVWSLCEECSQATVAPGSERPVDPIVKREQYEQQAEDERANRRRQEIKDGERPRL